MRKDRSRKHKSWWHVSDCGGRTIIVFYFMLCNLQVQYIITGNVTRGRLLTTERYGNDKSLITNQFARLSCAAGTMWYDRIPSNISRPLSKYAVSLNTIGVSRFVESVHSHTDHDRCPR